MTTIIAAIIVLGVLIFVHELGHFLVAKLSRVGVLTFSLGFGPKLVGKKVGETQYQVSMIPLGGYVKMVGEELGEKVPAEMLARSFSNQPVRTRLAIVFAGPFFNFLFAIGALTVVLMTGMPTLLPEIGDVKPDSPAQMAGLLPGDRILDVNGMPIQRWEDLAKKIHESTEQPIQLAVDRNGSRLTVSVTPRTTKQTTLFGDEIRVGLIGISPAGTTFIERFDPLTALGKAVVQSWRISELTVLSIAKIIEGKISAKTIGGPILIAQMAGQQAKAGFLSLLIFMAVISINLVILNILPIPVLDGWHLLMFMIEGIRRKPISLNIRERAQQVGIFIIVLLMLLVLYNDVSRILGTP